MKGIDAFDRRYSLTGYLLLLVIFLPSLAFVILNNYNTVPAFLNNTESLKQAGLSFSYALATAAAALLFAFPGIVIYSKCRKAVRNLLRVNFSFAFCFPAVLMNICFDNLFGNEGYIASLQLSPVIRTALVNLMLNIPLMIVMVGEYWRRLDVRQIMCARTIGSPAVRSFVSLTLPKLVPAILGTFALVLLRCISVSENMIISMLISVLFLIVLVSADKRISQSEVSAHSVSEPGTGRTNFLMIVISFIYMAASQCLIIIPGLSMILRSILIDGRVSFEAYRLLFSSVNQNWLTGLGFCMALAVASSVISSFICIHICVGIANTGFSLLLALLPFAVGPVALATGFTGLYPWTSQTQAVRMVFTLLCHILVLTPVQIMIVLPTARFLSGNLRKTSVSLGNTSSQSFRLIDLRIMDVDVLSAFFTSVALSIGSYGAAETLGLDTVYSQSLRLWNGGKAADACAIGSITLILCFIFFYMGIGHTREGKRNV